MNGLVVGGVVVVVAWMLPLQRLCVGVVSQSLKRDQPENLFLRRYICNYLQNCSGYTGISELKFKLPF